MIHDSQISIIIQGPIHDAWAAELIDKIRTIFINSQIIFSTWVGNSTYLIPSDVIIVENDDPGGLQISDNPIVHDSASRQIVSTMGGLRKANRKYSIKMRSDFFFEHNDWLESLDKYQEYDDNYKFLKNRVLVSSVCSVNPNKIPLPYHPSDWFFFGLTEDLVNIFDIPLLTEESANWFKGKVMNKFAYNWHSRYRPEQHIWTSFIRKHYPINFDHQNDIDNNNIEVSERIFSNNAVILDSLTLGIKSMKYPNYASDEFNRGYFSSNYCFCDWLKLYEKYSNPNQNRYFFNRSRFKNTLLWGFKDPILSLHLLCLYGGLLKYPLVRGIVKLVRSVLKLPR